MNDKTKIERLAQLKEVLMNLGMARCEQIELNHQVESMNDRINQLNLDQSAAKTKDAIMKVVDKRRHTRERQRKSVLRCRSWRLSNRRLRVNLNGEENDCE